MVDCAFQASAQQPAVYSVDRHSASMRELVTLHGSDFGQDPSKIKVLFGAVKGEIKSVHDHIILVRTPSGATFDQISVTNTASGRTAYTPSQFFINYRGEPGIAASNFSAQTDFQAQSGLYDFCLCDFDDDGKPDVATASSTATKITLFRNTSTPGNVSLTPQDFTIGTGTLHSRCGDLNGDGKPDLVLTEGSDGDRIFVLKNNGNFNFSASSIRLSGVHVKQVALHDLDLDGRPDIVITNTADNIVKILPNKSSVSAISFDDPVSLPVPGALSTDAIAVGDLNGDGLPEIVTSQYQADSENKLFIAISAGSFNFSTFEAIPVNRAVSNIGIADVDADTRPDLVVTRLTWNDVAVFRNLSSTDISFTDPIYLATDSRPVGLDFADFDGDGKLDIAVGSVAKSVSVLNNTTESAPLHFSPTLTLNTTYVNRNLRAADMDGDGKPDIVFTSVDDFSDVPVPASKISVIRNTACMVPTITPPGPVTICDGSTLRLNATSGGGVVYQWRREGTASPLKTGPEEFFDVTSSGTYRVTALGDGSCSKESAVVEVGSVAPSHPLASGVPDARSNSPVCSDNTLVLEVNDLDATEYRWRGPNDFTAASATPQLEAAGFTPERAGLYIVDLIAGNCVASTDSTIVEALAIPDFNVTSSTGGQFCAGTTAMLTVAPSPGSGFTYQWYERSQGAIPDATESSYVAGATGEYYAIVTPDGTGCAPRETPAVTLRQLSVPEAAFSAPDETCPGQEVAFSQQSTHDPSATIVSQWVFGNGKTASTDNATTVYESTGSFQVNLTISYEGVSGCSASQSKTINVVAPVAPDILPSATSICDGQVVTLSVDGPFSSVEWNTGATSPSIDITTPGDYGVHTVDEHGCTAEAQMNITAQAVPVIAVSAEPPVIAPGQTSTLHASGADVYVWSPGESLNDSTVADPVAAPLESTTYTVTGSFTSGCSATAAVPVQVSGEAINIKVPVLFSPNGDAVNEALVIEGAENYPDCSLSIFDRRGGKVFGVTGYQNNWDGTYRGAPLPEGVYYYVFGCPNKKAVTGTIAVIR